MCEFYRHSTFLFAAISLSEDSVFLCQVTDADTIDYNYEILEDVKKTAKACSTLVELVIAVHQELMPLEDQRSQQDEEWSHGILAAVSWPV